MKKINLVNEMPTSKGELNKKNMFSYVMEKGTEADRKWFATILKNNKVAKVSNLPNAEEEVQGLDLHKVREAFCVHFKDFYHLSDKAKREKRTKEASIDDMIEMLEHANQPLAIAG
jgi:hypothetical protein